MSVSPSNDHFIGSLGHEKELLETRILLLTTWSVIAVEEDLKKSEKEVTVLKMLSAKVESVF